MIKKQFIAGVLAASLFGFGGGVMTAQAFDFGSVLKLGGISYLVNQFGGEINTFINKIFSQNEVSTDYATKVVPILSMGTGGYIGAVQVVGPKAQVDKVKAVASHRISSPFCRTRRLFSIFILLFIHNFK